MTDVNVVGSTKQSAKSGAIPWPSAQPADSEIRKELEKRELARLRNEWLDEQMRTGQLFDPSTNNGRKELMRFQMRIFDFRYDFHEDMLQEIEDDPEEELGEEAGFHYFRPTEEELYYFSKYMIIQGRMEKEIPILALIYIERFL